MTISRLGVVLPPTGAWRDQVAEYRPAPGEFLAEGFASPGFDERVVYGPHSSGGERFVTDPAVHEQAIARLRG